jgi:hypothetical protein
VPSLLLRDCANAPLTAIAGPPGVLTIDFTPPDAVSNLASVQVLSGNDTNGTTKVHLTFSAPGDAAVVQVYRAWFGTTSTNAYPEYSDMPGAAPPTAPSYPPAAPWAITSVNASGQDDEPSTRGFWYYAVFTTDACGNISLVSNLSAGSLNYHLGDVTPLVSGDNDVDGVDVSALGGSYGYSLSYNDPVNYLDVGPTADYSTLTLPQTDNRINFEDLMVFAMNYGQVTFQRGPSEVADETPPRLALEVPAGLPRSILTARLVLRNNAERVKGFSGVIGYDPSRLELIDVQPGTLLDGQDPIFFKHLPGTATVTVDAASLGRGRTIVGDGAVATLRFRVSSEYRAPILQASQLRDRDNLPFNAITPSLTPRGQAARGTQQMTPSGEVARLIEARPNPFGGSTTLAFRLPAAVRVSVQIVDLSGRIIRNLVDEEISAGEHTLAWDGKNNSGQSVGAGVYFCRLVAGSERSDLRVFRYR